MTNLTTPDVAVFLAGGCYVLGYLIINQVGLRLLILLGTMFYIWYYSIATETPLWSAIILSVMIGVSNILGLIGLYLRRSKFLIPSSFRDLYHQFDGMPPADFRDLVKRANRRVLTKDEDVTIEGQPVNHLTYVVSGSVQAKKLGEQFPLPAGIFIGEVAFLTGHPASATSRVKKGSEILQWDFSSLHARTARRPSFKLALEAMISKDLAAKVAHAVAPHSDGLNAKPEYPSYRL